MSLNKKILAVDCDDVIRMLIDEVVNVYNKSALKKITINDIKDWKLSNSLLEWDNAEKMAFEDNAKEIYLGADIVDYAHFALLKLSSLYNIFILTYQPTEYRKKLTKKWLSRVGLGIFPVIFSDKPKDQYKFDYIVDDNPDTLLSCGDRAICFSRPWNLSFKGRTINNWLEGITLLEELGA